MRSLAMLVAFALFAGLVTFSPTRAQPGAQPEAQAQPKHAIAEVMQTVHSPRGGLLGKIRQGQATDEEKKQVLDLYISLYENKPPQGDEAAWKARTAGILAAYGKLLVGREGALQEYVAAANCQACHSVHRPPQQ